MDVTHTPTERGYDQFQLCKQFNMKIRLWTSVHPNHFYFHYPIWLVSFQKPYL